MRLDDFWSLKLCRPNQKQLLRRCLFLIRKCQFRELISSDRIKAMFYLQHDLSKVVDRSSEEQMSEFHQLTNLLFRTQEQQEEDELFHGHIGNDSLANNSYRLRSSVFDALAQYFPESMAQPRLNLSDFVSFDKNWSIALGFICKCFHYQPLRRFFFMSILLYHLVLCICH